MRVLMLFLALSSLLFGLGCAAPKPAVHDARPAEHTGATAAPSGDTGRLTISDAAGNTELVLVKTDAGYQVSSKTALLAKLTVNDGKVAIHDALGKDAGSVKTDGDAWMLKDAGGAKIAKLKPKDGGYRLKDAADVMLLKIKPREQGGFKVSNEAGDTLGKVKLTGNGAVIDDAQGKKRYTVTGAMKRVEIAGLLLAPKLTTLQKAALICASGM